MAIATATCNVERSTGLSFSGGFHKAVGGVVVVCNLDEWLSEMEKTY